MRRTVLLVAAVATAVVLAGPGIATAQEDLLVNSVGNPILADDPANPVSLSVDESGNPVLLDGSGNPVSLSTDEFGNFILVDESGDPVLLDDSGNPIVENNLASTLCTPLNPDEVNALVPGCIFGTSTTDEGAATDQYATEVS